MLDGVRLFVAAAAEFFFSARATASATAHAIDSIGFPHDVPRRERTAAAATQPTLNTTSTSTIMSPIGIVASL